VDGIRVSKPVIINPLSCWHKLNRALEATIHHVINLPICHTYRQRAALVGVEFGQTICLHLLPDDITAHIDANCVEATFRLYIMSSRFDFAIMQRFTELSSIAGSDDPPDDIVLSDQNESAPEGLLTICSWCKKAKIDGEWVDIQNPFRAFDLFASAPVVQLTHGICPSCAIDFMAEDDEPS